MSNSSSLSEPAVAQTDHGNLFGTIEFYEKALANNVKPIIGCEVYIAGRSRFDKEGRERTEDGFDAISHLLLLAMNEIGYRNLMYLVSKGYLEGFYYKPRIDMDLLRGRSEGLIATSGCLSAPVPRAILLNEVDRAWTVAEDFPRSLVKQLAIALQVRFSFLAELHPTIKKRACLLALWDGTGYRSNFEYDTDHTACEHVFTNNVS